MAVARARIIYDGFTPETLDPALLKNANAALDRLETALTGRKYLVGDSLTIADIALLAYTRLAPEGGMDLTGRPAVLRWIAVCEQELGLPAHVAATKGQ